MVKLRPSAASSWVKCHAAPRLRANYPEDSGDAAEEGTAGHFACSQLLTGKAVAAGDIAPNGIQIDAEMIKYAGEYVDIVTAWDLPVYVEQFLPIPEIFEVDFGGTPDAFAIDYTNKIIKLIDYKYGWQIVECFENWQLLCYLSGIMSMIKMNGYLDQEWCVEFIVFQPRAHHVEGPLRSWITTCANMRGYFNVLADAAQKAMSNSAMTLTGSHCRYCSARHACVTLQQSSYIAVELSQQSNTMDLNTVQAGRELLQIEQALEVLKSRQSGLEAQLEFDITVKGIRSPHFEVKRAVTREKWQEGKDALVISMGAILGKNLAKPPEAISPAQCRKLHIDDSVINAYSMKPTGENKLVKLETLSTKRLFGK